MVTLYRVTGTYANNDERLTLKLHHWCPVSLRFDTGYNLHETVMLFLGVPLQSLHLRCGNCTISFCLCLCYTFQN